MLLDWAVLLKERNEWVAYNFPNEEGEFLETIWGCMEEVGELAHAHLKERQNIRGTAEEHQANAKDALGDLAVYLLGCMKYGRCLPNLDYVDDPDRRPQNENEALTLLGPAVGQLCEAGMASRRVEDDKANELYQYGITRVVYLSERYCYYRGWDYNAIVQGTWDSVKERDWIKYPNTGRPDGEDFGLRNPDPHLSPQEKAARSDGDPGNATTPPAAGGYVPPVSPDARWEGGVGAKD